MKIIITATCIVLLLLSPISASAFDKWDQIDWTLLTVGTSMQVIDWRQTRRIAEQPQRYHEINPLIGSHPSLDQVDMYFAIFLLLRVGVAHVLPSKWRKIWLGTMAVGSAGLVAYNTDIGLGISW